MAHPTRIFKTPDDLLKVWEDYKLSLKHANQEWEKVQYVGKDGVKKIDYPKLPLTFEGFKVYCWDNNIGTVEHYFVNKEDYYTEFGSVCARIKTEIRKDQIEGGMLGFYNPSITQRLNNLTERTDVTTGGSNVQSINVTIVKPDEPRD
jgi:hypothetical protein